MEKGILIKAQCTVTFRCQFEFKKTRNGSNVKLPATCPLLSHCLYCGFFCSSTPNHYQNSYENCYCGDEHCVFAVIYTENIDSIIEMEWRIFGGKNRLRCILKFKLTYSAVDVDRV